MLDKKLKKKVFHALSIIALLIFSLYYTNKSIDIIREQDDIMKSIHKNASSYKVESENAEIIGNKIIPGKKGKEVDLEKSYTKMKKYGTYNESLTVLKEIEPTISLNDYYDKYVIRGNTTDKTLALVFPVSEDKNLDKLVQILKANDVAATFFLDGALIESNSDLVKNLHNYELELLSYNSGYEKIYFTSSLNYLTSLSKQNAKYCYSNYDQKEVIELCASLKLHTIIPTIKVSDNTYSEVKTRLTNSAIISIPSTSKTLATLDTTIKYLKQKGYTFFTLADLLTEGLEK